MNCKVKQGCLTSESCCILLWLAFTLFPVSVVTAADNRKIDESQQKEVKPFKENEEHKVEIDDFGF